MAETGSVQELAVVRPGSRFDPNKPVSIIGLMCVGAFGPYVIGSIRTEQAIVYSSFVLGVIAGLANLLRQLRGASLILIGSWSLIIMVATVGAMTSGGAATLWRQGSALGGLDNLLLPMAAFAVTLATVKRNSASRSLLQIGAIIVWLTVGNALVAIVSSVAPLDAILRPFWSQESATTTVAENAQQLGRFSGIFGQPAEAGLVYGIAGLIAVLVYNRRAGVLIPVLAAIFSGGALCVSKVFLIVGAPLILGFVWASYRLVGRLLALGAALGTIAIIWYSGFLQEWHGFGYLVRLIEVPNGMSLLEFYTAGRWNGGSPMSSVIRVVMSNSPLSGYGLGGLQVAYDSAWTEMLVLGGVLGIIGFAFTLVVQFHITRRILDDRVRLFASLFWVLIVGASFGIPSLTANRVSTIAWVIFALLSIMPDGRPDNKKVDHAHPANVTRA